MNKRKILIIGANERMRRKAATLINRLQGAIAVERESCTDVSACFANRRIDAVLLENDAQVEEVTLRIRNAKPGLPILAYADDPSYENTRSTFLAGVRDVLCLRATTSEEIGETLEKVLDPARRTNADETLLISQAMEVATLRGRYLEEQLLAGNPPPFYMNGNRARLLLGKILPNDTQILWRHNAIWEWIQEFGLNNSFLFSTEEDALRLGVILEQDYINQAAFQKMLSVRLERLFARLKDLNCLCAVASCSSDFMSLAMMHRLNEICDLAFYLRESALLDDRMRQNTILSSETYTTFCAKVATRDVEGAVACIDQTVQRLRADMHDPEFARGRLNRFLWNFIAMSSHTEDNSASLRVNDARIDFMRDSIVRIIERVMGASTAGDSASPMTELIRRIDENPGADMSIDFAAAEIGFSRSHFCRLFRQQTGMSFTKYVNRQRIRRAQELLSKTSLSLGEVADIVGISNVWYFKKLFEKETGATVDDWRAQTESVGRA